MVVASQPTIDNYDISETSLFAQSVSALREVLGKACARYGTSPIPVAYVASQWGQREIQEQLGTVSYPYLTMTLQQFALMTDGYNDNLRRGGIYVSAPDSNIVYNYKLTPVTASFRIQYLTNDNLDMSSFFTRWVNRQRNMQFKLEKERLSIHLKVLLNTDLSVPEETNEDYGTQFVLETNCTLMTYVGEVVRRPKITKVVFNANVVTQSAKVGKNGLPLTNNQIPVTTIQDDYTFELTKPIRIKNK